MFCFFSDHDLLEEHLGHIHMATCFDFPDLFPDQWGFVKPTPLPKVVEDFIDPGKNLLLKYTTKNVQILHQYVSLL